jgi:hypothetical protein
MGGGGSKTTATAESTNIINDFKMNVNDFNQLNSTMNNVVANTLIKSANSSAASATSIQKIDFSGSTMKSFFYNRRCKNEKKC